MNPNYQNLKMEGSFTIETKYEEGYYPISKIYQENTESKLNTIPISFLPREIRETIQKQNLTLQKYPQLKELNEIIDLK